MDREYDSCDYWGVLEADLDVCLTHLILLEVDGGGGQSPELRPWSPPSVSPGSLGGPGIGELSSVGRLVG